jgi:NTF2 fold immunity protein
VKYFFSPLVLLRICSSAFSADERPKDGFVPDAETAIKIATAVWARIYSPRELEQERPFCAYLKNGVWTVEGTLP